MGLYAKETNVSPEKSLAEIRQTLTRYKATKFGMVDEGSRVVILFEMRERRVRFNLSIPSRAEFDKKSTGGRMGKEQGDQAHERAIRQRWRALLLVIKAKLESVESGVESFEEAFMGQLVLPSGETMAEWAKPQLEQIYLGEKMPPMLGSRS